MKYGRFRATGQTTSHVVAAVLLAFTVHAHANLGFENGLTGWTVTPTPADSVNLITGCDGAGAPACITTAPVYQTYGIRVEPISGNKMIRLGRPAQGNQSQAKGTNSIVSDPIAMGADALEISLRLFSYESRGTDRLVIEVLDQNFVPLAGAGIYEAPTGTQAFTLGPVGKTAGACAIAGPTCSIYIRTPRGKESKEREDSESKAPYDSGLDKAFIRGIANKTIRLRYSSISTEDSSKPTWVYLDAFPLPVSAKLFFSPGNAGESGIAAEGDTLFFDCASAGLSVNPNGGKVNCKWLAQGGGLVEPQEIEGPFAMFWFPDDDPATVSLTVTDPATPTNTKTIVTGENGVPAINLENRAPSVTATNVEVVSGGTGTAECRFADPGIGQIAAGQVSEPEISEASVNIGGATNLNIRIESEPQFTTGTISGKVTTAGAATCSVTDRNGETGSATFDVAVLTPQEITTREAGWGANDTTATATPFTAGNTRLAYLSTPGDIDVYSLTPPAGSEVQITMNPTNADYDLIVLAETFATTNPALSGPLVTAPLYSGTTLKSRTAPLYSGSSSLGKIQKSPLYSGTTRTRTSPLYSGAGSMAKFTTAPLYSGGSPRGIQISPLYSGFGSRIKVSSLPLSEFADTNSNSLSTSDLNWTELGTQNLRALQGENIEVVAVSAALGGNSERALVQVAPGTKKLFFAVVATAGALSELPYSVSANVSTPVSQKELLSDTGLCAANTAFAATNSAPGTGSAAAATGGTLVLTQRERFLVANGIPLNDPNNVWGSIQNALPASTTLVSLPGSLYTAVDADPCNLDQWRSLAKNIKTTIGDPTRFAAIGILGGADVIPPFVLPDVATVGNERYFDDILARAGSLVSVATLEGNALVYGCYGDAAPLSYLGGDLCIEDVPVFVLVETPQQVIARLSAVAPVPSGNRVAFGYPPFDDGLTEAAAGGGVSNVFNVVDSSDPSQWWSAEAMRREFLACRANPLDLAVINAHMSPNAALSALGDLAPDALDFVSAGEAKQCLANTVTLSMGCHSGLNIPSSMALTIPVFPFDPKVDWTEQSSIVAPTGFGLGSNGGVQLTEKLIALMAEKLSGGQATLGEALVSAKQDYLLGLQQIDPHDAKSLSNLTLFGWPTQTLAGAVAPLRLLAGATSTCTDDLLRLRILPNGNTSTPIIDADLGYCRVTDARGSWYTLEGEAQSTYPRPLLPVTATEPSSGVDPLGLDLPHSLVQVDRSTASTSPCLPAGSTCSMGIAGNYVDEPDTQVAAPHFDPVFPLPQTNWSNVRDDSDDYEPYACIEVLSPTQLGGINTLATADATLWSAVVTGAQFRCDTTEIDGNGISRAKGTLRRWTNLDMDAVMPTVNPSDFVEPKVEQLDVTAFPQTGEVNAVLRGTDATTGGSGIKEIIMLVFTDPVPPVTGFVTSYSVRGSLEGVAVPFKLANASGKRLAAWVIDGAGNASYKSLKGQLFEAVDVNIITTQLSAVGTSQLKVQFGGFSCLTQPTLTIDYSDGRPSQYLDLTLYLQQNPGAIQWLTTGPGCNDAIITIPQNFGTIGAAGITVTVTIKAGGAIGSDTQKLLPPPPPCSDPSGDGYYAAGDIVACSFTSVGTQVTVSATMRSTISSEKRYRLYLPQYNAELKLSNCRTSTKKCSVYATNGLQLNVNAVLNNTTLRFIFNAAPVWNGTTPLQYSLKTEYDGKTIDSTAVFTAVP